MKLSIMIIVIALVIACSVKQNADVIDRFDFIGYFHKQMQAGVKK